MGYCSNVEGYFIYKPLIDFHYFTPCEHFFVTKQDDVLTNNLDVAYYLSELDL